MNALVVVEDANQIGPAEWYLLSVREGVSRESMRSALNMVCAALGLARRDDERGRNVTYRDMEWRVLRYEHMIALRDRLITLGYAPKSINKMLGAVKGVLYWCMRRQLVPRDAYEDAIAISGVDGEPPPPPHKRALAAEEFGRMLAACEADRGPAGVRDAAILWLLYSIGCRREEIGSRRRVGGVVVGLTMDRWDAETRTLTLMGKGRKARTAPVEGAAFAALTTWLGVRGDAPGGVFVRVLGQRAVTDQPLRGAAIYDVVKRRAAEAQPQVENVAPHTFRRTVVTELLRQKVQIVTVQRLVGHASLRTTQEYDMQGEEEKRAAVLLRDATYQRRG